MNTWEINHFLEASRELLRESMESLCKSISCKRNKLNPNETSMNPWRTQRIRWEVDEFLQGAKKSSHERIKKTDKLKQT